MCVLRAGGQDRRSGGRGGCGPGLGWGLGWDKLQRPRNVGWTPIPGVPGSVPSLVGRQEGSWAAPRDCPGGEGV